MAEEQMHDQGDAGRDEGELDQGTFTVKQGGAKVGWVWTLKSRRKNNNREVWLLGDNYKYPRDSGAEPLEFADHQAHATETAFRAYAALEFAKLSGVKLKDEYVHTVKFTAHP